MREKSKIISIILLTVTLLTSVLLSSCSSSGESELLDDLLVDLEYYEKFKDEKMTLNIFNWGEYISKGRGNVDIVEEFQKITGIKVNYSTFATNEELLAKLTSGGASYDLIVPSDYMINRMINENMLEKINFENVPNIENIMEQYRPTSFENSFDPTGEYSVPYTWGTVVLIYNTKYVEEPVDSWSILWDEKYSGKIIMFSSPRDTFAIAQKKLGYSANSTDKDELNKAKEELIKQKPLVQGYFADEIFNKMGNEEAYLAPYYAGDAITMIDTNPDLAVAYPKEGTNLFIDAMCIPKGAKNKEAAEMFITFMCEPAVAAANCEFIGYSTPNAPAYELLSDDLKNNEISYPSDEVLANTEMFLSLPRDINEYMDEMWSEILGASSSNIWLFPVIVGVVLVGIVVIIIVKNKKKKSKQY